LLGIAPDPGMPLCRCVGPAEAGTGFSRIKVDLSVSRETNNAVCFVSSAGGE
jgi:hypothetical protein